MKFKNFVIKNWPIIAIFLLVSTLFAINYKPGTWLTGWDNLHPEFDFGINIKRSIFAVWQEYQSLGLLGGMGHAAALVRELILYALSFILPSSLLRYFWTFLMLFVGGIGTYRLIGFIQEETFGIEIKQSKFISFLGGVFYILNLATIQNFYAPFEAFITHYAFLPWLLLTSVIYFLKPSLRNFILLSTVLLLATPGAYIPTLFVVYLLSISILLFVLFFKSPSIEKLKRLIKLYLIIFIINAFWLLPFFYFTLTSSSVALDAKINQMATETIFLQNKEFGNITDVMQLKGFWFNNVDPDTNGVFTYMLAPWREYLKNPLISSLSFLFFAVILIGCIYCLKKRKAILMVFLLLFAFSFTMLATSTTPFSEINILFRKFPLFNQAFRFPFTKFSILASLTYAIFFAIGVKRITEFLDDNFHFLSSIFKSKIIPLIFVLLLIVFTLPAFKGQLFYEREKIAIPKEYFELFDFFKKQDQNTRIANFPQYTFWGWNFYRWGYGGSGFLWYGIQQPILDRAFDVWSKNSENYYFEISNALYTKDPILLEKVLNKYQINFLLIDKNIFNPPSPKALFIPEAEELLSQIPSINKVATFGNLEVFKVNLKDKLNEFVFLDNNLSQFNSYNWGNYDKAYVDYGNYISNPNTSDSISNFKFQISNFVYYPFRSLFSNKTQEEIEFNVKENNNSIEFTKTLPILNKTVLKVPSILKTEKIIPVDIYVKKNKENTLIVNAIFKTPEISIDNNKLWGDTTEKPIFIISPELSDFFNLNINGVSTFKIDSKLTSYENRYLGTTFLTINQDNVLVLADDKANSLGTGVITSSYIKSLSIFDEKQLEVLDTQNPRIFSIKIPKIKDSYLNFEPQIDDPNNRVINCDNFRKGDLFPSKENGYLLLSSNNTTPCISYYAPKLFHEQGYLIFIKSKNIKGRSLHFWMLNEDEKFSPIDTYLPSDKNDTVSVYAVSPQDQFGKSYSFHFDNISIQQETTNILGKLSVYPIPYNFLTSIVAVDKEKEVLKTITTGNTMNVSHLNESLYKVSINNEAMDNPVLILSQSFDPGWKAYEVESGKWKVENWIKTAFPFIFGKELKEHVLINNWENGWRINNSQLSTLNSQLIIVYWPQYLEYAGFCFLIATFLFLALKIKK